MYTLAKAQGEILSEDIRDREAAIDYLLKIRLTGTFVLVSKQGNRLDIQWLLVRPVNSREVSISCAYGMPGQPSWQYLVHRPFPRPLRQVVQDTVSSMVQGLKNASDNRDSAVHAKNGNEPLLLDLGSSPPTGA